MQTLTNEFKAEELSSRKLWEIVSGMDDYQPAQSQLEEAVRELAERAFADLPTVSEPIVARPPQVIPQVVIRNKELEQSHVCLGTSGYRQDHDDRYASYVMNTILGGSMSSRLFQNVREVGRAHV